MHWLIGAAILIVTLIFIWQEQREARDRGARYIQKLKDEAKRDGED